MKNLYIAAISSVRLYIQVDDPDVDYLVDTASLKAFYLNPNWRKDANERIDVIRKNNISITYVYRRHKDAAMSVSSITSP